jgi:tetratricopeptide (TPR) repeat protein
MLQHLKTNRWLLIGGAAIILAAIGGGITGATQSMNSTSAAFGAAGGGIAGLVAGSFLSSAISRRDALERITQILESSADILPTARISGNMYRPSWLLNPDNRVAPFRARRKDLEYLDNWHRSDGMPPLLFVTGRPYVGKTRFISEYAAHNLHTRKIIRVREGNEKEVLDVLLQAKTDATVIVEVVQPRIQLIELLERAVRFQESGLKVIFVCRSDSWISFLPSRASETVLASIDSSSHLNLHSFGAKDDLLRWLIEITTEICKLLELPEPPSPHTGPNLDATMMEVSAMAVVGALEGRHLTSGTLSGPGPTIAEIGTHLIRLESKFWLMPGEPFGPDGVVERRCIWILSILGASSENEAVSIARRLPDLNSIPSAALHSLVRWVREVYPAQNPDIWTDGPQPDFLFCALCRDVLENGAWLVDVLQIDLPGAPSLSDFQYQRAARSLAQTANVFPDASEHFTRMISRTHLAKLPIAATMAIYLDDVATADEALAEYITSENLSMESLRIIEDIVDERFVNVNAAISMVKAKESRLANDLGATVQLLVTLANRQSLADQDESAADSADEAVQLYRALAISDSQEHRAHLAAALMTLAGADNKLHRFTKSAAAADEAVQLYRALAISDSQEHRAHLAAALMTLAGADNKLHRFTKSAAAADEAVQLYRALAISDSHRAHLAAAIMNWFGCNASRLESDEVVIAVAAEAVELYRTLASSDHETYDGRFAEAAELYAEELRSQDKHHLAAENFRLALAISQQAIVHPVRLGGTSVNTQRASIARLWLRIGRMADIFDMSTEERAAVRRAVNIFRELFSASPNSYRYDLVDALKALARANIGSDNAEVRNNAIWTEVVALARNGDASDPITYSSYLINALHTPGGPYEENVPARTAVAEEEVNLSRFLDRNDRFFTKRNDALWGLARVREESGAAVEADKLFREAVDVCQRFYGAGIYGRRFKRIGLAQAKTKYALFLDRSERYAEALEVSQQIIDLFPEFRLGQKVEDDGFSYLFGALSDREKILKKLGRLEEARLVRQSMTANLRPDLNALNWPVYSAGDLSIAAWFEQIAVHHNAALGILIAARNAVQRKNKSGED